MTNLKTIAAALLSIVSLTASAQDLIASQAPADKKLKDIQLIQFQNTGAAEGDLQQPAATIYSNWTRTISDAQGIVPAGYRIDLRGFHMPTPSRKINSPFGRRWGRLHAGLDIKVYLGDTIRAAFDGKVRIVKYNARGYGYYVVIRHTNGLETLYGHLSKQLVEEDQTVRAGDVIGLGGNTGRSFGSHLHFETRLLGQPINPAFMFDFENQDVTGDYYTVQKGMQNGSTDVLAQQQEEGIYAQPAAATPTYTTTFTPTTETTASPQQKAKTKTHTVRKGDTLSSIARKYGLSVSHLRRLNGLRRSSVIRAGQVLRCS